MSTIHLDPKDLHAILQEFSDGKVAFDKGTIKFTDDKLNITFGDMELTNQLRVSYGNLRVTPDSIKLNAQGLKADFKIGLES